MKVSLSRIYALIILLLIVVYGVFRIWVQRSYSDFLISFAGSLNLNLDYIFNFLRSQAEMDSSKDQPVGWLIYYPTYLFLHLAFIHVLFFNEPKTRRLLQLGLIGLVGGLVLLWIFGVLMGWSEFANMFRIQFRKLFGLPFILLVIEGGRILYKDLKRLNGESL